MSKRKMSKGPIDQEDYDEYFSWQGMSYAEVGLSVKHGSLFKHGAEGWRSQVAVLERKLDFQFPAEYLEVITDPHGEGRNESSSVHFRSGWWRVLNSDDVMVLWSFSLSLQEISSDDWPQENTLIIEEQFRQAGLRGVPFGQGFRICKKTLTCIDGWLYFDRDDLTLRFTDFDFAYTLPLAPSFLIMMKTADMIGFDA